MADPLVVGVLYVLPGFDNELVLRRLGDCPRPVELVVAPYEETHALRTAKGQGAPEAELRALSPELSD